MFSHAPIRLATVAGICRRVGTALEAGVDARKAWSREADNATGRAAQPLRHVADALAQGNSLPDALAGTGEAFPRLLHDLVAVGEETGHLDRIFLRMADHCDHMLSLRRLFLGGIFLPALQFLIMIGVLALVIFIMGVIPQDPNYPIDLLGLGLRGATGAFIFLAGTAGVIGGLAVLVSQWMRGNWGARQVRALVDRIPGLGSSLQTMAVARMAWTFSLTADTPLDVGKAMGLALRSSQDPGYVALETPVRQAVRRGSLIHQALRQTGKFPVEFLDAVEVGEETGRLSESLVTVAHQFDQRARLAARTLTIVGSFLVWGIVAAIIIYFIFRIALMYTGIINDLAQPGGGSFF